MSLIDLLSVIGFAVFAAIMTYHSGYEYGYRKGSDDTALRVSREVQDKYLASLKAAQPSPTTDEGTEAKHV